MKPAHYNDKKIQTNLMNQYILVDNDKEMHDYSFKFAPIGAAIGGGFNHASKLIPKKYKETMMGSDKDKQIEVQDGVFQVVDAKEAIASGQKVI